MPPKTTSLIQNPHLEGENFFWPGSPERGKIGILLSHGFTATTAEVRPMATVLNQAGYTVSGPLLPGHGGDPQEANQFSWKDWVATIDSATRILQEQCSQVFLGGESLGGLLALYQASTTPQAAGVLLFAPAIRFKPRMVGTLTRVMAPFIPLKTKPHTEPSAADFRWQGYTVYPLKAMKQLMELQKQVRRRLAQVSQPILLIQGRKDRSVHPTGPEIITRGVSSKIIEVHWIENSGHCVILEDQCEQVEALTMDFVGRLGG